MRKAPSKAAQERIERMLNELLKLPGNDQCADCTQKNPRWASYSLGIFLCIRCCSLHRKMGTHISKVKSVSMDRWTAEEVQFMKKLGGNKQVNSRVNPSPALHPLPLALDDDHAMELYIRNKWQKRAFEEEQQQHQQQQEEEETLSTFECSTTSDFPSTSSTTSSLVSSPTQLAGQVFPPSSSTFITSTHNSTSNPFLIERNVETYSPTSFSNVNPFNNNSNNPFALPDKRMSMNPFYNSMITTPPATMATETTTNGSNSRSNSYNPFLI